MSSVVTAMYQPRFSLAEEVLGRDAHVVEEDLVELVAARHVHEGAHGEAGGVHRDHEVGDALVLRDVGVGAGEAEHVLGHVGERGPDLLAVDDVVVAVADGAGLEGGEVGAGLGLGEALAPHVFAGEDAGDVLLLLLVGAVHEDGGPEDRDAEPADEDGRRGRACGRLHVVDELLHDGHLGAAVLLRPAQGDVAGLVELRCQRFRNS